MLFNQTVSNLKKGFGEYDVHEDVVMFRSLVVAKNSVPQTHAILSKMRTLLAKKNIELESRELGGVRSRINRKLQKVTIVKLHDPKDVEKADKLIVTVINESKDKELMKLLQKDEVKK